ncbi:hypothetical protein Hanom_Chr07g00643811 [Helianthus anomalus]
MCIVSVLWYCISHVSILLLLGGAFVSLSTIFLLHLHFHLKCEIVQKKRNCVGP